ncbi:MAG: M1 family metallopeptidase [bacterium]|nr:M1 family metallopeptidase [bacterium]
MTVNSAATRGRVAVVTLILSILTSALMVIGAPPAQAAGGLTFRSDATFTVMVDDGYVNVDNHITLTNVKPDKRSGYRITQYYYDRISIGIPDAAEEVVATSGGRDLSVEIVKEDGYRYAEIRLRSKLFYKRTQTVDVNFKIYGDDPRSFSLMRVNPAYVSFYIWAWGDSGKSSLTVIAPEGFHLAFEGDHYMGQMPTELEGMKAWQATEIKDPNEWAMIVSGQRDEGLLETDFSVDEAAIRVLSWPGDEEWLDQVRSTLEDGLPALVEVVGLEWPVEGDLIIRESITPNRFGYAGWYFTDEDEIEMGEDLDPIVVLHEASHAWFNDDLFLERWIVEGLASATAGYVARTELGEQELPRVIRTKSSGAVQLNSWGRGQNEEEREQYAYNASWWIMYKIVEEVGVDRFNDVIVAADANLIAYRGTPEPEAVDEADDWKRFLDLTEELAGSETATDLIREYVATSYDIPNLDRRQSARDALAALEESSGWVTPIVIRRPMAEWEFGKANAAILSAEDVVDMATTLAARAAAADLEFSDIIHQRYEVVANSFDPIMAYGAARIAAIDAIEAAAATMPVEPDLVTQVGLWRSDDPADLVVAARDAYNAENPAKASELANQAVTDLAAVRELGEERKRTATIAAGVVLLLLLILITWLLVRRRRRRRAAKQERLRAEALAAEVPEDFESGSFDSDPIAAVLEAEPVDGEVADVEPADPTSSFAGLAPLEAPSPFDAESPTDMEPSPT